MVIKGILEQITNSTVNLVNADLLAKTRGLRIIESIVPAEGRLVTACVVASSLLCSVQWTVMDGNGWSGPFNAPSIAGAHLYVYSLCCSISQVPYCSCLGCLQLVQHSYCSTSLQVSHIHVHICIHIEYVIKH